MNTITRISKIAEKLIEIVATILFLSFFVTLMIQVITRYVLHLPLTWTEELARLINVWVVSLGSVLAVKRNDHIRVSMLDKKAIKLKEPFYDTYLFVTRGLVPLVILILMLMGSYTMVLDRWPIKFTMLPFSQGLLYLPLLISSIFMTVFLILNLYKKKYNGGGETE